MDVLCLKMDIQTGIQKYKCPGCSNTCCETIGTVVYHSKLSFEVWKNVIDNLLLQINRSR